MSMPLRVSSLSERRRLLQEEQRALDEQQQLLAQFVADVEGGMRG